MSSSDADATDATPEPGDPSEPSAFTFTFTDEGPDIDELTLAFVQSIAELNPDLRLESVTFRLMNEDESRREEASR